MSNIKHAIEEVVGHTPILELDGLEKKEQFVINSKVVMCEITQNISSELSEDNNILVLGLQNGSFSIYSMNNFENKYSLKISDAKI